MDDDVDMRHYGALRKMMPVTFLTFAMGYLAIIGFPGFSGFWSKDKIIETALTENSVVGLCALLGAGITGFYMTRLMLMTFFTDKRWEPDVHPHESPKVMTIPLIVLAALSVLGGFLLLGDWIVDFLAPGGRRARRTTTRRSRRSLITLIIVAVVAVGVDRWPGSWSASARCRARRRRTSRSSPGRRAPTSTATRSTTASSSSPARRLVSGLLDLRPARRRRAASPAARHASARSAACSGGPRTASSAPTRSRCSAASCSSSWRSWR